jgi:hypothetical protein
MLRYINRFVIAVVLCAFMSAASPCSAGTIIKLSLGGDGAADVEYTGGVGGVLSTVDDLNAATTGNQNTAVEFLDILDSIVPDIFTTTASFTLDGLSASGVALPMGSAVFQNFTGGTLELYDAANTLLLSGSLDESLLAGTLGPPGTGGLITTSFGQFTGGTLAPYLDPDTLALSIALGDVNGGAGLSVSPIVGFPALSMLNSFTADASVIIAASPIPEPAAILLMALSVILAATVARCRSHSS